MWMAWRLASKKKAVFATLAKVFHVTSHDAATICKPNIDAPLRSLSTLVGGKQGYGLHYVAHDHQGNCICGGKSFVRNFHGTHESLDAYRDKDGRRTSKIRKFRKHSGKFRKNPNVKEVPVETSYVPPRLMSAAKSSPDKTIDIFEGMTILELAKRCDQSIAIVQQILVNVGEKFDSEFDHLSIDVVELVAMEVGINVRRIHSNVGKEVLPRPPVVSVMGHVDHGKTSLLDALRQTAVAASEAGGITQHLGAFVVRMQSGAAITFLDTPGHAAFSAMRARGAAVTDIVVLVVAADDGVMPQTLEAISHAKAAGVSIIVAINKCDKPAANPQKVKTQLVNEGLPLEEIGGDIQVVEVSAVNKSGLDKLEEAILLEAEMMELKSRIDGPAQAYVVEARVDRGRGPLATAIVKAGTLLPGQHVVVGAEWGRIRAIRDMGKNLTDRATPAMPVEIEGLKGLPRAGDDIVVVESEERAKMLSKGRTEKLQKDRLMNLKIDGERRKVLEEQRKEEEQADEIADLEAAGSGSPILKRKENKPMWVDLPIVVKADVQGTVQAVSDALKTLTSPQVLLKIVHAGVGSISQSDVDMAHACGACIVGFNVPKPPISMTQAASRAGIKFILHRVIYHLLEDMGNLIVEQAPGIFETQVAGQAEVLNIFEILGNRRQAQPVKIAGCRVVDGRFTRASTMKVLRSGDVIFEGECASLKKEKQDVETVEKGSECGLILCNHNDIRVGDVIQCLEQVNRKPKFISSESGAVRIEC